MKFDFDNKPQTKPIGCRATISDYDKITKLSKKFNSSRGAITRVLINTALKNVK